MYDYGKVWGLWSDNARNAYIWGFKDGVVEAYSKASEHWTEPGALLKKPEPEKIRVVRESVFLIFPVEKIRDVMTQLYADAANCYIPFDGMVLLARGKLKGEDIDKALVQARKTALDMHILAEKTSRKE